MQGLTCEIERAKAQLRAYMEHPFHVPDLVITKLEGVEQKRQRTRKAPKGDGIPREGSRKRKAA